MVNTVDRGQEMGTQIGKIYFAMLCLIVLLSCGNPVESVTGDPPADGLVVHWELDGNGLDASGNGHDGTVTGALPAEDRFGSSNNALQFDGIDDVFEVPDFHDWDDQISISAWVNVQGWTSENATIIEKHGEIGFTIREDDIHFYLASGKTLNQPFSINTNQWTNIVATWDGSTMKIFVNGEEIGSMNASGTIANSSYSMYVASDESHVPHHYLGLIDDVRIYNIGLNSGEILNLYHEGGWE